MDMTHLPLAERLRPTTPADYIGQTHLMGPAKPLRRMLEQGTIRSMILWGPPGSGKTSFARLLQTLPDVLYIERSAVTTGVQDIRSAIQEAETHKGTTILFLDEIHRFTKAQQDSLLPHVERGTITLVGATTENPGFEVIGPLISRAHVYHFEPLTDEDIRTIIDRAWQVLKRTKLTTDAIETIVRLANGDARTAINTVELINQLEPENAKITPEMITWAVQRKVLLYDKKGDAHYDTISAFIKSLRGSDPDAALHYLARMLESGEDPLFIARRLVIFAAEDVGNALPTALVLATSTMQAVHLIGLPEAQLLLAQATTYLATAPKSRAVTRALEAAQADLRTMRVEPVPLHLRNPVNQIYKNLGAGKGYRWPRKDGDQPTERGYLPSNLQDRRYYEPPK